MPFVYTDLKAIENEPPVGNGDCVTLIKEKVPGLIGIFWVLDQWKNKKDGKITKRFMYPRKPRLDGTFDDPSNAAQAFSVIELR